MHELKRKALVFIEYLKSEGPEETAQMRSLFRAFATSTHHIWKKIIAQNDL